MWSSSRRLAADARPGMERFWALLLIAALVACAPPRPLPQDAYVWQRVWTPGLRVALAASAGAIGGWRVLAAELDGGGVWREAGADLALLAAAGKPVTMVLRIEGQLAQWDSVALRRATLALLWRWRAAGVLVAAVEIDHDCGTGRLAAYAGFLSALRAELPADTRLSLTALPAWLGAPALAGVLASVDEAVLQVHAVSDPRAGLFDARRARAWMDAFDKVMERPWRVALPAYGSRVAWDDRGRIAAVESERPVLVGGVGARELLARPEEMAAFLARLDRDRPARLAGIAWFRLPTGDDRRAWSLPTWLAVTGRRPLNPHLTAEPRPTATAGLYDVVLTSDGATDAGLPAVIRVRGACEAADGVNGFAVDREAAGIVLRRTRDGLLRPGQARVAGWLRCAGGPPALALE